MIKWTVFFVICVPYLICAVPDSIKYGPYNMVITAFTVCSGPKAKSCTSLKATITGNTTVDFNLQVLKAVAPTKGKVVASTNGKEMARLHMNKPCEHLFLRSLFETMFNASTKNCLIQKGDYSRKVDIGTIANNYSAGNFFYGNLTFRAQLYSDECNFSCSILKASFTPK